MWRLFAFQFLLTVLLKIEKHIISSFLINNTFNKLIKMALHRWFPDWTPICVGVEEEYIRFEDEKKYNDIVKKIGLKK